jgi:hypothetical protein
MNLIVEMRASGAASIAQKSYFLTPFDMLSPCYKGFCQMCVYGLEAMPMVDM